MQPIGPAAEVYIQFLNALNKKDLKTAVKYVNTELYQENCVAFTDGYVGWIEAKESLEKVWEGLPDLHVELTQIMGDANTAIAHGVVSGTALGKLYGAPATKRAYKASFFDYVKVEDGLIVERVQQADVLGQMRQLYGKGIGLFGLSAMYLRQPSTFPQPKR